MTINRYIGLTVDELLMLREKHHAIIEKLNDDLQEHRKTLLQINDAIAMQVKKDKSGLDDRL